MADRVEEGERSRAAVLSPCSRDPLGETDFAQAKVVRTETPREDERERELATNQPKGGRRTAKYVFPNARRK